MAPSFFTNGTEYFRNGTELFINSSFFKNGTEIVYGLGGYTGDYPYRISIIAQFQNNFWQIIGDLKEAKCDSSAIFYEGEYLVIGGDPEYTTRK